MFDSLTPPRWGGSKSLGSNDFRINPHLRAKFGCSQTVVSKGGGGTDRHTQRDTAALSTIKFNIVDGNAMAMNFWSRTQCEVTVWIGKGRVTNRI